MNQNLTLINSGMLPTNTALINFLNLNILGLMFQSNRPDYTSQTTVTIYNRLLELIGIDTANNNLDPNFQNEANTIIVVDSGNFTQSARIPFGLTYSLTLNNWPTLYFPTYGDNPEIQIFVGDNVNGFQQDTATVPIPVFPANDISQPLQSISWTWPVLTQGYYIISGQKPA